MILNFDNIYKKYNLDITGILHIGGHYGNEISEYQNHNVNDIVLFEPLSNNYSILTENIKNKSGNIIAHKVALGNDNKKVTMNVSDNEGQSSSVLNPKVHLTAHPEVSFIGTEEVEMKKLDDYNYKNYNMIVIDVQGYELEVFKGATKTLEHVDYIFCEVNRDEVYEGNAKIEEIDQFLLEQGFERMEVEWYYSQVFGDAFYMRTNIKKTGNVSIICACKNRYNALLLSLNSWLMYDEIKEIIIVDWSSDQPINHITKLDPRIKVITVPNKTYFNQPQPLNLAASFATGEYILKMDCDYIINPYYNFFEKYSLKGKSFVSGRTKIISESREFFDEQSQAYYISWHDMPIEEQRHYFNGSSPFHKFLIGLLYIKREYFNDVGGFNENLGECYAYEDGELFDRLKLFGLEEIKLEVDSHLIHIAHDNKKRVEHFIGLPEQEQIEKEIRYNLSHDHSGQELEWQAEYAMTQRHIEYNKLKIGKIETPYVEPKTKWKIDQVDEKNYIAVELISNGKLNGFPSVYYVSLEESLDRRMELQEQFKKYNITPNAIISKRYEDSDDIITGIYVDSLNGGTKGCCVSHLKAIKKWYEDTNETYGFFCEDDLSLETVDHWSFTWEEFMETIPSDAECIQLFTIRGEYKTFSLRERLWDDWGATAYIIRRDYAKKIIETFIKNESFNLEIPNKTVMPLIENILFHSVGKCYTIPMFVENIKFDSTFVGKDDDVKDGHKTNHKKSRDLVLNYWKNKVIKEKTELEELLTKYSLDTENPEHNFNLGLWYENQGHTAPALSYYLRCAERACESDPDLAYEALIRGSYCYEEQGTRDGSSRSLLFQAQAFRTDRPEAYFLLSNFAQKRQWWQDCYLNADLALRYCNFDCPPLRTDVKYPGKFGLLYQKAIGGWWWGKVDESRSLMIDALTNYDLDEVDYKFISDNLRSIGGEVPTRK